MRRFLLTASVVVTVVAAIFLWPRSSAESRPHAEPAAAIPVEVLELQKQQVPLFEELPARTVASEVAEIRPQVTGIITERQFVEGSSVKEGQQLYQIDPAPYEAAHRSAAADLQKAKANVVSLEAKNGRFEELVKIHAVSKQQYDDVFAGLAQAKADIAIAEAAVATTKINLGYTKVYAPIGGKIGKSLVTKGALVTANQQQHLTTITRLDPIYVDIVQPAAELFSMRERFGAAANIRIELLFEGRQEKYPHRGELQFADVTVDESTGSVQLRALFPNPEGKLLPGMFVRTRLEVAAVEGILLPQRATMRDAKGLLKIWVVDAENTVKQRAVTAEEVVGDAWLVTEGAGAGDRVVVKGIQKLADGALVAPTPFTSTASEPQAG